MISHHGYKFRQAQVSTAAAAIALAALGFAGPAHATEKIRMPAVRPAPCTTRTALPRTMSEACRSVHRMLVDVEGNRDVSATRGLSRAEMAAALRFQRVQTRSILRTTTSVENAAVDISRTVSAVTTLVARGAVDGADQSVGGSTADTGAICNMRELVAETGLTTDCSGWSNQDRVDTCSRLKGYDESPLSGLRSVREACLLVAGLPLHAATAPAGAAGFAVRMLRIASVLQTALVSAIDTSTDQLQEHLQVGRVDRSAATSLPPNTDQLGSSSVDGADGFERSVWPQG